MVAIVFCGYIPSVIADDEPLPSSAQSTYGDERFATQAPIGSYYDESWEAAGFYSTGAATPLAGTTGYGLRYHYTAQPEGKTLTIGGNSASLPSDAVVVEWKVCGHVHFVSGL